MLIAVVLGLLVAGCAPPEETPGGILGSTPEGVTVPEFNEMSDGESSVLLRCQLHKYAERMDKREAQQFFLNGMEEAIKQKPGHVTPLQEQLIRDKGLLPRSMGIPWLLRSRKQRGQRGYPVSTACRQC